MSIKALPTWNANNISTHSLREQREHDFETRGIDSGNWNSRKTLEVAVKEFIELMPLDDGRLPILMSILQHKHESMVQTAKNMALTPEERKALEERRSRIEKLRNLAEDKKLEEDEAMKMLELLLTSEDKELLEKQIVEHKLAFV